MEEDLKILEDFIKYFEAEAISRKYRRNISITVGEDDIQAIENLIKGYKELEKQYKILEVEKVRYNIQYLESDISQIPDTAMVYHSMKRDIETLKEQKIKLEKELQELLQEGDK